MIKKLTLKNFRKFKDQSFELNKNIVIFYGSNAQGKSSVLEAIYLINTGDSPWASMNEYINVEQNAQYHTRIETVEDENSFVYFKDKRKRTLKIDGKNVRPQTFFNKRSANIFNPEKIELLMISPSQRRNFLDDNISKYDFYYKNTLKEFRKILKQRNAYLKKLSKMFYEDGIIAINDPQLNFWSNNFCEIATEIVQKRMNLAKNLSNNGYTIKYNSNFDFDKRRITNSEYVKESIQKDLENSKKRDIATGYTNLGPHRDDWDIIKDRDIRKFGSRGEKRLAIGQLVFQIQEIIHKETSKYPILLLDDIASELDILNTKKIFDRDLLQNQQSFITVIDYNSLPKEIVKEAQLIHLNGN